MSKTTKVVTREELLAVPLPEQTETYTVISHEFAIENVTQALIERGFEILSEEYRCTNNGEVARGSYVVEFEGDEDMQMMFSWVNSYDKSTKFSCGVGAYIMKNQAYMISKEMTNWVRKHTGSADTDTIEVIQEQADKMQVYFAALKSDKDQMKSINVDPMRFASLLGRFYIIANVISTQQLSAVKKEMHNPSFNYGDDLSNNSLWVLYNHILYILKGAHPKNWMKQQTLIHYMIKTEFGLLGYSFDEEQEETSTELPHEIEEVDPNQLEMSFSSDGNAEVEQPQTASSVTGGFINDDPLEPIMVDKDSVVEWNPDVVLESGAIITLGTDQYVLTEIENQEGIDVCVMVPYTEEAKEMMEAYQEDVDNGEYPKAEKETPYVDTDGIEIIEEVSATEEEVEVVQSNPELQFDFNPSDEEEMVDKPNPDFTISHNSLVGMGDLDDLPVDDSPQIDGIPNGDTMSDTSDDDATEEPAESGEEQVFEEDPAVKAVIASEVTSLFGEEKEFTYKLIDDTYHISFTDGSTIEFDKELIELLQA